MVKPSISLSLHLEYLCFILNLSIALYFRLWSKKYPIMIELKKKSLQHQRRSVDGEVAVEEEVNADVEAAADEKFEEILNDECEEEVLYLFARADREKDIW